MLYKLWEEGKVVFLDDSLEKFAANFTIKNLLGKWRDDVDVNVGSEIPSLTVKALFLIMTSLPWPLLD
jgi:hypothetical protein